MNEHDRANKFMIWTIALGALIVAGSVGLVLYS